MRIKLAIGIYLVAGAVEILVGATYFMAKQFMSYHAEAVGMPWDELGEGLQTLVLALMKFAAGGWFALGIVTVSLTLAALRSRNVFARWTLPVATIISWSLSFVATWGVYRATGAATPWLPSLVMIGLAMFAFTLDAPWSTIVPHNKDASRAPERSQ